MHRALSLLILSTACDPKDASDCEGGFVRAEDGNCYPIVVDTGSAETDADADADADTDTDTDADADTDTDTDVEPRPPRVVWESDRVILVPPAALDLRFWGMAETDCTDECWTGEDCLYGYTDGTNTLSYCHPTTPRDVTELTYGGDVFTLSEGSETVFSADFRVRVTHYAEEVGGRCHVWGHDTSYYAGQGCTVY